MTQQQASRVWLITGAGRGFGRRFTQAALDAGDRVVATARNPAALDDLLARYRSSTPTSSARCGSARRSSPKLRAQRSGHIVQLSSIFGLMGMPTQGLYAASKFAVEGMSDALAGELEPFGPPRRLLLGDGDDDAIFEVYHQRMAEWANSETVSHTVG